MIEIRKYTAADKEIWDNHIRSSANGTFILERNYMEYHANRFQDFSLLAFEEGKLIAVFPANISETKLYSHRGLTYGGLIIPKYFRVNECITLFYYLLEYLTDNNISSLYYKCVPAFYHRTPNEAEHFVLSLLEAKLTRVDTSFIVKHNPAVSFQERRMRAVKKAKKAGIELRYSDNFDDYWNKVLSPHLKEKYDADPVHSLDEIKKLHSLFPNNILQCDALYNNEVVAGATMYLFDSIAAHAQYIASTNEGRNTGAIDYLFFDMITNKFLPFNFFSFGTANNSGNDLNFGVAEWKEGWKPEVRGNFFYEVSPSSFQKLKNFIQ